MEKQTDSSSSTPVAPAQAGPPSSQQKTRYAKAQERLEKTWEAVNKRKSDLDTQAQQLGQQRLAVERDKTQIEAVRRQAEQP